MGKCVTMKSNQEYAKVIGESEVHELGFFLKWTSANELELNSG